jgi:hypothetical protein
MSVEKIRKGGFTFDYTSLVSWKNPQLLANLDNAGTNSTRHGSSRTMTFEYIRERYPQRC